MKKLVSNSAFNKSLIFLFKIMNRIFMHKKYFKFAIIFLIALLIGFWIYVQKFASPISSPENLEKKPEAGAKGPPKQKPVPVNVKIMTKEKLGNKFYTNGSVISNEEVDLKPEISGKITKIYFNEGKIVKKGDLLVKLNDADWQAQLKKAISKLELLQIKESRQKRLIENNNVSKEEYDIALSDVHTQQAEIEYLKAMIEKTEIKAPFDGIIGLRYVSEGAYISPTTNIAKLQNISSLKIDFSIPQKYSGVLKIGSKVKFKIPSTEMFGTATVYAIEPKIDPLTRTVKMRAVTNNSGGVFSGSYVEVEILLDEIETALLIPTEALVPDIDGEKVFIYHDGMAIATNITSGLRTKTDIQITHGLEEGDTVIISGIIQLRPNSPVKLIKTIK